jgi:Zn-dependent protease with chaperone function
VPLPYSFILGLLCLLAVEEFGDGLPRPVEPAAILPYLGLLLIPWAVARFARPSVVGPERRSRRDRLRGLLRVAGRNLIAPGVYLLLIGPGQLSQIVATWSESALVATAMMMAPLIFMEFSGEIGRRQAARQARSRSSDPVMPPVPFRLTMIGFLAVPLLVFAVGLDLIALHRGLEVFVHGTGIGGLLGFLLFIVVMSALLPVLFRVMVSTSTRLPPDVLATAARLGFPTKDVFELRSNHYLINAALVGPIPRLRYLFLTDGLLRLLDPVSLRGVVAHEVGHARAGHPLWLFTLFLIVPLLSFQPLEVSGFGDLGSTGQSVSLVAILAFGVLVMHRVAHRFEFEADQLSAEALGGATPCFLALHKIGELFGGSRTRSSFRHPSEERRLDHLLRCESDPVYLARFHRRGVFLRWGILGVLLFAVLANVWAQRQVWPIDRVVVEFYTGRFPEARRTLDALPDHLPPGRAESVARLDEELRAAETLFPDGGEWEAIRGQLAARALERGRLELIRRGAASARAWFALAVNKTRPTPLELSLYRYCEAAGADDEAVVERYRAHLLGPAFARGSRRGPGLSQELDPGLRSALERD